VGDGTFWTFSIHNPQTQVQALMRFATIVVRSQVEAIKVVFSFSQFSEFGTMQKEDSSSHQTCGTCMKY
jgi:hypothetical protein